MNTENLIAHISKDCVRFHGLHEHLSGVADLANGFANRFGNGDWGEAAGRLHDLGKASDKFQTDIRIESTFDVTLKPVPGKKNHSSHGAKWAVAQWGAYGKLLSYLVAGHHGGLPDWYGNLENRLSENDPLIVPAVPPERIALLTQGLSCPKSIPASRKIDPRHMHLWLRMLFSCLVDADFLDTESFMEADKTASRGRHESLELLKEKFDGYMKTKTSGASATDVNRLRAEVLMQCRQAGGKGPGYFTLTVPTGGGKTLSAMAFALEHAIRHGKQRIIFAIPYTSIIEQTADEYRKVFGTHNVLEHHSALDPDQESQQNRLAAENWDAPIIVTTNVQLFESLFANRTGACRKLHNLVDSVVVLDEAQMLPPEHLKPILQAVRALKENFGVTFVFCTATQPALTGEIGSGKEKFEGLDAKTGEVSEITTDPDGLFRRLKRVDLTLKRGKTTWDELAGELSGHEQVLCVVNTRRDCRDLHKLMPEGTFHLSANMCAAHRSHSISLIKERLRQRKPIRVISTQLVEAGVDIDFPIVYRAMAGLDSIAQAAGRCNREGLREKGEIIVFDPPQRPPSGLLRKGEDACQEILGNHEHGLDLTEPNLFGEYFRAFYGRVNTFDLKNLKDLLETDAPLCKFQFATAAKEFQLIDDEHQQAVVVDWRHEESKSRGLIEQLRLQGLSRTLGRQLQRYVVNLPRRVFENCRSSLEEIQGCWCLTATGSYDGEIGFVGENIALETFVQ